jgi:hypothetical protein
VCFGALYHDNAPAHTALSVMECLASKQITVLEHHPYSPDLAPGYFFLFPEIREILKGWHFDDIDDIKNNTTAALKVIPQNEFQNCIEELHWSIDSQEKHLKANTVIFSNEVCSNFTAMSSRSLMSDHVRHNSSFSFRLNLTFATIHPIRRYIARIIRSNPVVVFLEKLNVLIKETDTTLGRERS